MKRFNEHDTVVYTNEKGQMIDTFVIYDTDPDSGLTHINHMNLKVPESMLQLHPLTIKGHHMPMRDSFSFEIFKKLKEKFLVQDKLTVRRKLKPESGFAGPLAKAS
ncbi:hypothetical protein BEL04_09315 [Mucilaginibacter sp. PPCGB 2223]|uniref:hypothetical protein n=1 Tax=Mucilaginibacter sp. PPCGB 2223 TaxID=1886027 RepID=UPI000825B248|nr:hypothetical protein [Mucilaginibacter sp. PPCGB 2223]OCX54432.1 hypothetical protein BEL04_09315 [Mucilaginibacter sp. PPCGB 2223]